MSYTAGTLSILSVSSNSDQLSSTQATGGTGPYTVQWYRSTTTGFSPGGGNIITGATSLTLNDSGLIPNTPYYYKVVYTDTGFSNDTITSSQLTVTTTAPSQSQNQFSQAPFLGETDLKVGPTNVTEAMIDVTQSGLLYAGSAVNVVNGPNGIPTVVGSATDTDNVWGFIVYDIKSQSYPVGARCGVAQLGTCIWLYATNAIARGAQVVLDLTSPGGVQAATGSDTIVGYAYDQATAYGQLIRIVVSTPSFLAN
jgi:hypothetical protein